MLEKDNGGTRRGCFIQGGQGRMLIREPEGYKSEGAMHMSRERGFQAVRTANAELRQELAWHV